MSFVYWFGDADCESIVPFRLILAPYVRKLIDDCEEERGKDGEHD